MTEATYSPTATGTTATGVASRTSRATTRQTTADREKQPLLFIIFKKDWQCTASRERLTPYQSEDPNPTTPTHRMKEEKGKTAGDKK